MKNNNLPDNAIEITDLTKIYKNNNCLLYTSDAADE